jgi:hypothetical protein
MMKTAAAGIMDSSMISYRIRMNVPMTRVLKAAASIARITALFVTTTTIHTIVPKRAVIMSGRVTGHIAFTANTENKYSFMGVSK